MRAACSGNIFQKMQPSVEHQETVPLQALIERPMICSAFFISQSMKEGRKD